MGTSLFLGLVLLCKPVSLCGIAFCKGPVVLRAIRNAAQVSFSTGHDQAHITNGKALLGPVLVKDH